MFRKLQVTLFTHKTRHQNVFQAANNTIYAQEIDLAKTFDDILLSPLFSWDCWLKNHNLLPRVSFFLTAQLRHYSPFWKLFNSLTAPVYCGCCALIGSLLMWPWLALKIDITASLDSGPLSFSLCTVLNEKGDRGTVWKRIKRAEDFEFSSTGDFAIKRKNGRNYVERKIFRPKRKGWHLWSHERRFIIKKLFSRYTEIIRTLLSKLCPSCTRPLVAKIKYATQPSAHRCILLPV